jgi:hypothetical protein
VRYEIFIFGSRYYWRLVDGAFPNSQDLAFSPLGYATRFLCVEMIKKGPMKAGANTPIVDAADA